MARWKFNIFSIARWCRCSDSVRRVHEHIGSLNYWARNHPAANKRFNNDLTLSSKMQCVAALVLQLRCCKRSHLAACVFYSCIQSKQMPHIAFHEVIQLLPLTADLDRKNGNYDNYSIDVTNAPRPRRSKFSGTAMQLEQHQWPAMTILFYFAFKQQCTSNLLF